MEQALASESEQVLARAPESEQALVPESEQVLAPESEQAVAPECWEVSRLVSESAPILVQPPQPATAQLVRPQVPHNRWQQRPLRSANLPQSP